MKHTITLLTTLLLAPLAALPAAEKKIDKPNIIVILTDDQGYADLSCQHQVPDIKTPNLDSLAGRGVRLTAGYVTAPQCSPSRAGLMSGRYQQKFGLDNIADDPMPLEERTIPERLKKAGYVSGQVGKWHLDPNAISVKWARKNLPRSRPEKTVEWRFLGNLFDSIPRWAKVLMNASRVRSTATSPPSTATATRSIRTAPSLNNLGIGWKRKLPPPWHSSSATTTSHSSSIWRITARMCRWRPPRNIFPDSPERCPNADATHWRCFPRLMTVSVKLPPRSNNMISMTIRSSFSRLITVRRLRAALGSPKADLRPVKKSSADLGWFTERSVDRRERDADRRWHTRAIHHVLAGTVAGR